MRVSVRSTSGFSFSSSAESESAFSSSSSAPSAPGSEGWPLTLICGGGGAWRITGRGRAGRGSTGIGTAGTALLSTAFASPGAPPCVASRSITSRSRMRPSLIASRHSSSAVIVIGLSQMPPIILSWPASMRLAISISPSRLSSSTEPISRRYMRTGSSVRPNSSSSPVASAATTAVLAGSAAPLAARSEEHTSELQSHRDLHSFPTRRSSDLVHAHGIVGAAQFLVLAGRFGGDHGGFGRLGRAIGGGGGLFLLLGLDHVNAGFRQHRHGVLDLLGGHFVGRQGGVQFVVGDVAALLALLDELLELSTKGIEQGGIGALFAGFGGFGLGGSCGLGRHCFP